MKAQSVRKYKPSPPPPGQRRRRRTVARVHSEHSAVYSLLQAEGMVAQDESNRSIWSLLSKTHDMLLALPTH